MQVAMQVLSQKADKARQTAKPLPTLHIAAPVPDEPLQRSPAVLHAAEMDCRTSGTHGRCGRCGRACVITGVSLQHHCARVVRGGPFPLWHCSSSCKFSLPTRQTTQQQATMDEACSATLHTNEYRQQATALVHTVTDANQPLGTAPPAAPE